MMGNGRLGTPGVAVMFAGLALLYWGLGILRQPSGGNKVLGQDAFGEKTPTPSKRKRGISK